MWYEKNQKLGSEMWCENVSVVVVEKRRVYEGIKLKRLCLMQ